MKIDGYTRLAAVVANPIKHSISPFIHNFAFNKTGVNGVYLAWEIPKDDLAITIDNIKRYNMFGINVSMPYKQAVIPYMDQLTDSAKLIGAVNTVINKDGKLIGHNTDGIGFFKSLSLLASFDIPKKNMIILGGGGASTAIMAQAALNGVNEILLFCRQESLKKNAITAKRLSSETHVGIQVLPIEDNNLFQEKLNHAHLLVNGTNQGMDGKSLPIPKDTVFPSHLQVADVIYQPFETPLIKMAKQQGLKPINGLGMLLYQAAEAFKCWTNQEMPTDEIWNELVQKYNID